MENDPRDSIWENTYELYYDSYFNEMLYMKLAAKWSHVDIIMKVLIAATVLITTALSLSLRDDPSANYYWFGMSLILLVLVVVYIALNITGNVKKQLKGNKEFWGLCYAIESFRDDINREQDFDIDKQKSQFEIYTSTFNDICRNNPLSRLASGRMLKTVQNEVNRRLAGIIQKGGDRMKPGKRIVYRVNRGAPHPKPQPRSRKFKYIRPRN